MVASRSRARLFYLGAVTIIVAIGLGVGLGVGLSVHRSSSSNSNDTARPASTTSATLATTGATNASVTPLPKFDWTKNKFQGVALGNYLVLERWMYQEWFVGLAGNDSWDEWDFSRKLGAQAVTALKAHYASWFTEADMDTIQQAGFNSIRLPIGFWALIPTTGDEPYVNAGQMDVVSNVMQWAYKRQMYILLDLHGMPGNQNGEQQSGHNTSSINFYNSTNQARADATLKAALTFVQSSPYSSVIAGISAVNEPRPFDSASNLAALRGYYDRSYATLSAAGMPMIFHHAFVEGDRQAYWSSFMAGKNPSLLVLEDHPYPGNFPAQTDRTSIMTQVCNDAKGYQAWPVPVAITEWSLTSGVNDTAWMQTFYKAQLTAWSWSAGSSFWAYKAIAPATEGDYPTSLIEMYSFVDLVKENAVVLPAAANTSSTAFLASLQANAQCGAAPTKTYANPIPSSTASASA